MRGYDAFAGVIKSGGKTRRAAKMVILDIDHPDILEFTWCKAKEEKKAHALIDAGYDGAYTGEAYGSISFQNANNSVRVTDEFMNAVEQDKEFQTKYITNGEPCETFKAKEIMRQISDAAWQCGDPGIQYDTTINDWHMSRHGSNLRIKSMFEYMFLNDCMQSGIRKPNEVPDAEWRIRRSNSNIAANHDHGAGNSGRFFLIPESRR